MNYICRIETTSLPGFGKIQFNGERSCPARVENVGRVGIFRRREESEMSWNGSGQKGVAPAKPKVAAKKPSPVRGVIAGLVVVAAVCVAYFAFFSGNEKVPEKVEKKPKSVAKRKS